MSKRSPFPTKLLIALAIAVSLLECRAQQNSLSKTKIILSATSKQKDLGLTVELPIDAGKVILKSGQALLVKITLKNTGKSPFAISKPPPYGTPVIFKDSRGKLVPEKLRVVSDPAIPLPQHFKILQPSETVSFYFSTEKHRIISRRGLKVGTGDTDYELEIGKQYQLEFWYSDTTLSVFKVGKKWIPFATAVGAKQWVGEIQTKLIPVEVVRE